jgi:dihydroneopterin aldolase
MKESLDQIAVRSLAVDTVVGVHDWERSAPRRVLVDLDLTCDLSAAARSDDLRDTADYFAIAAAVRDCAAGASFRLIEALAGAIAAVCLADRHVRRVRVTVHKPGAVPQAGDVSVTLERGRD